MTTRKISFAAPLVAIAMTACVQQPDYSAVSAERAKPVQRYDTFLAAASNGRQLVTAGGGGVLVTSVDGGKVWQRQQLAGPAAIVAMANCPDGSFAALDFYRKVWIGNPQASDWQAHAIPGDFSPMAIDCDASGKLWVVGTYSTILSSADRGASWQAQPPGEDAILTAVQFVDAQHGYIAGEFGTFMETADGGQTWTKKAGLPEGFYPYAMVFADATHGWLSGVAGAVLHTVDGGLSWSAQANADGTSLYALLALGSEVIGAGSGGQVLALAGDRWTPLQGLPKFPSYLAAGAPLAPDSVLVAGAAGALQVLKLRSQLAALSPSIAAGEMQP